MTSAFSVRPWLELTKFRLTALVVVTTGFGYMLGAEFLDVQVLCATALGTTLLAVAASAVNQWVEIGRDRKMERTKNRPLVTGEISEWQALLFALVSTLVGAWLLWSYSGQRAAILGLISLISYIVLYTPLKPRSTLSTLVGAVPGALPPLIGWVAATHEISIGGLSLFTLLFLWQIPHFLAIGWLYREDYSKGGFEILGTTDVSGKRSARFALIYTFALVPVSLVPALVQLSGWIYLVAAPLLGLIVIIPAAQFFRGPDRPRARRLFLATLVYLPLLFCFMLLDPTQLPASAFTEWTTG